MKKNIISNNSCPLCFNKNFDKWYYNNKNVYSFLLSKALKIKEKNLIKKFINVKCSKCGLIYKRKWMSTKIKKIIYKKIVPIHPTGKDILSNNFSYKVFKSKIKKISSFIKKKNTNEVSKLKREIKSLLEAIDENNNNFLLKKKLFLIQLNKNNFNYLNSQNKFFQNKFKHKKKYSRFSGYGNNEIWSYINQNISHIKKYAEIGCPAWGMMKQAKNDKKKIFFLNEKNSNFWECSDRGSRYYKKNKNCFDLSKKLYNFESIKLNKVKNNYLNFIGIYNYLDHIEKPFDFFNKIRKKTYSLGLIIKLMKNSKTDVQHFTTWTKDSLIFLANRINFKIIKPSFELSNNAGCYKLYIFKKNV